MENAEANYPTEKEKPDYCSCRGMVQLLGYQLGTPGLFGRKNFIIVWYRADQTAFRKILFDFKQSKICKMADTCPMAFFSLLLIFEI